MNKLTLSAAAAALSLALPALAVPAAAQTNEITIGITVTTTGPAAALGIPERNALEFVAKEIAGVPLKVIVLDDGGDPTNATNNARRFVTESKADIIMGSSTTPPSVAVSNVANEAHVPHIGLAPFPITPERAKWSVTMPQPIPIVGKVMYDHMKAHNVKTVGYIGYSDSYGDLWINDLKKQTGPMGIKVVDEERFARPDTSVTVAAKGRDYLNGQASQAAGFAVDYEPRIQLSNLFTNPMMQKFHSADEFSELWRHGYERVESGNDGSLIERPGFDHRRRP